MAVGQRRSRGSVPSAHSQARRVTGWLMPKGERGRCQAERPMGGVQQQLSGHGADGILAGRTRTRAMLDGGLWEKDWAAGRWANVKWVRVRR
jgi:hypothetical protein